MLTRTVSPRLGSSPAERRRIDYALHLEADVEKHAFGRNRYDHAVAAVRACLARLRRPCSYSERMSPNDGPWSGVPEGSSSKWRGLLAMGV